MKRSLANSAIRYAEELLNQYNFKLPEFGYWNLNEWRAHKNEIDVIKKLMLGWDLTDHGLGRFDEIGCTLFTIRNGLLDQPDVGVPYAEKLLIFKDYRFIIMDLKLRILLTVVVELCLFVCIIR